MHKIRLAAFAATLALAGAVPSAAPAAEPQLPTLSNSPSTPELVKLLALLDDRVRNGGDYKAVVYLETKEKDKADVAREAVVYRRDTDQKLMILFEKPKSEQGKGYLRIDKNLWLYDPNVGKWERRTERERIAGTDSRRADFDQSRMAEEYDPKWLGKAKLGQFTVDHLKLQVKEGVDVAFPIVELWVEEGNHNILKRQEFALSGRLMRTLYYPKWEKIFSESKNADVWFAREIRIYDEVEKANQTLILIRSVDLHSLPANLFTKAWLEAQSR